MSGDGFQADVVRLPQTRPTWAVPLLLFLALLVVSALAFNLANLNTGAETPPIVTKPGDQPPSAGLGIDPAIVDILLVVFGGAFITATIYILLRGRVRSKKPMKPPSWWEVLVSVLGVVLIFALLFSWPRVVRAFQGATGTNTANATATASGNFTAWPASLGAPLGLFLALTVLVTILVLSYLLRRGAGWTVSVSGQDSRDSTARAVAASAVQTAIQELELGGDVRTAILGCFQRFCGLLGARGIGAQEPLTPRELEGLAVARLRVSHEASETLTSLFEEARYSEHPLGESDRARALESLAGIRTALEA
jgi:hypothetical protein